MIVSDGNYEKSTLINAKLRKHLDDVDILDFFADKFNIYRSSHFQGYVIEQPIKSDSELIVNMSYKRKLPGKNKLIQEETRYVRIAIRKKSTSDVAIDIRQPSSFDAQKALELLQAMTDSSEESEVDLAHVNLDLLTDKNKVNFYDQLSAYSFDNWKLKTVVGITKNQDNIEKISQVYDEDLKVSKYYLNDTNLNKKITNNDNLLSKANSNEEIKSIINETLSLYKENNNVKLTKIS